MIYKYAQITIKHPVLVNDKHDLSEIHKRYKKFGLKQTFDGVEADILGC